MPWQTPIILGRGTIPRARAVLCTAAAGVAVVLAGCASPPPAAPPVPSMGSTIEAEGDWDDIGAAVSLASDRVQWAILSRGPGRSEQPGERWELMNVRGEPGWLEIRRSGPALAITARLGRFGDVEQEQRLIAMVAARLAELRGVEAAPAGPSLGR